MYLQGFVVFYSLIKMMDVSPSLSPLLISPFLTFTFTYLFFFVFHFYIILAF